MILHIGDMDFVTEYGVEEPDKDSLVLDVAEHTFKPVIGLKVYEEA